MQFDTYENALQQTKTFSLVVSDKSHAYITKSVPFVYPSLLIQKTNWVTNL